MRAVGREALIFFPLAILISQIVLAFLFAVIAQLFYRRMGLDFRSIVKGFIERMFLLVCLSNALPHALAMFGALKVATRLTRKDVAHSEQASFNDFFLIGNLVSAVAAVGYARLLQCCLSG
jgi:hypothetical protein